MRAKWPGEWLTREMERMILEHEDPFEVCSRKMAEKAMINKMFSELKPREYVVVGLRFGIKHEPMSLGQVAKLLGVSVSRIRQIEMSGLRRLRKKWNREEDPR